jgi:hypothetical protein
MVTFSLAHVPDKWTPVFRKGHAPTQESKAHPMQPDRDALSVASQSAIAKRSQLRECPGLAPAGRYDPL